MRDNVAIMRSHPREKAGRNDPCPCGSGKKFKRCCLSNDAVSNDAPSEDTPWQRQNVASKRLSGEMMRFAERRFGAHFDEVWADFNQVPFPKLLDKYPGEEQIFFPYFLFDWDPDRPAPRRGQKRRPGVVAQSFMEEKADRLPALDRLILELSISQPVSFYEVVRCDAGRGMRLRDVLIGGETEVEEHSASRSLRQGDIIYTQLCPLPDVTTLSRTAPVAIPPGQKPYIIGLRARLRRKIARQNRKLDADDLIRHEEDIRSMYLSLRDALHAPPKLTNTDGEPLLLHTLTFRIGSAQVAFDAMAPLAWSWSKKELLEGAEVDKDGTLRSVAIDWIKKGNRLHKTWENTILGHMEISGQTLVVNVNSAQRAGRISREIEKRLGILAVHQSTRVTTQEEMLESAKKTKSSRAGSAPDDSDLEANRILQEMMQEEAKGWVHKKLPVLGGFTPMKAIAHPDGKEIVEALLLDWERKNEGAGPGEFRTDVKAIRRLLNL